MNSEISIQHSAVKGTVRIGELLLMTGLARSTIYARLDPNNPGYDKNFPRPIALGVRARGWLDAEIEAYLVSLPKLAAANKVQFTSKKEGV